MPTVWGKDFSHANILTGTGHLKIVPSGQTKQEMPHKFQSYATINIIFNICQFKFWKTKYVLCMVDV